MLHKWLLSLYVRHESDKAEQIGILCFETFLRHLVITVLMKLSAISHLCFITSFVNAERLPVKLTV